MTLSRDIRCQMAILGAQIPTPTHFLVSYLEAPEDIATKRREDTSGT